MEKKWFLSNGNDLWRTWTASPNIDRRAIVKSSRKEYTCILGCKIPKGSKYIRLEIIAGGGCGSSILSIALCLSTLQTLLRLNTDLDDIQLEESYSSWLANLTGNNFFKLIEEQDSVLD